MTTQCSLGARRARHSSNYLPRVDFLEDRTAPAVLGSIGGHAFTDLTGNGPSLDDVAKKGVVVNLFVDSNNNGRHDKRDKLVASTKTASDGGYEFTKLAAGTYFVSEKTPKGYIQTAPVSGEHKIHLAVGEASTANDFANFNLLPPGKLARVTYTIERNGVTKTVHQLNKNTLAGDIVTVHFTVARNAAPLQLSLVSYNTTSDRFDPKTQDQATVADSQTGTFGPGRHSLTVQIPNSQYQVFFVRGAVIDQFGPAKSNISYKSQCRIISADAGGAAASVPAMEPSSLSGRLYDDSNRDGVINDGDGGLGGIEVYLTGTNDLGNIVSLTVLADANGRYLFTGLRPGTYAISHALPENFSARATFAGSLGGIGGTSNLISGIVVKSGQNGVNYDFLDEHFLAAQNGSISGAVYVQEFEGGPFGVAPNVTVRLLDSEGNNVAAVATDSEGRYSFGDVATGAGVTYTVLFVNPDTQAYYGISGVLVDLFDAGQVVTGIDAYFNVRPLA